MYPLWMSRENLRKWRGLLRAKSDAHANTSSSHISSLGWPLPILEDFFFGGGEKLGDGNSRKLENLENKLSTSSNEIANFLL